MRILVIGGVAGGATAASKAKRCCPDAEVEIFDQDRFISYAGCGLPYFLAGEAKRDSLIARTPKEFSKKQDIQVHLRHQVLSLEPEKKRIKVKDLDHGREFYRDYDRLIICTGARSFVPPIEGRGNPGVFTLRSLSDALRIEEWIKNRRPRKAVIVGAGAIGLEMCESFRALGMEVALVELEKQVMPPLDRDLASLVREHLERNQVELHLENQVMGIEGDGDRVTQVITDKDRISADLVLLSIGIRPASELALEAGLEVGARGAIRVNEHMRTSNQDIFAAGDCATTVHRLSGEEIWMPLGSTSRKQGRVAGTCAAGGEEVFPGVWGTFILKSMGLIIGKTGFSEEESSAAGFHPFTLRLEGHSLPGYYPGGGKINAILTADSKSGRLLGAQLVGDVHSAADKRLDIFSLCLAGKLTIEEMQYLDLAYAPPFSSAVDLPIVAGNLLFSQWRGEPCACDAQGLE